MNVIVDTDVWSEAFRRKGPKTAFVDELQNLIREGRIQMTGPIRMEILCGIRDETMFQTIQKSLTAFPDRILEPEVFVTAARFFNLCRSKGIQGSNTDFVICACSMLWEMPILTKDKDFVSFREALPIDLATPRTH